MPKPLRYTLDNVTFADGGTASGYFEAGYLIARHNQRISKALRLIMTSACLAVVPCSQTFNYFSATSGPMSASGMVFPNRLLQIVDGSRKLVFIPDTNFGTIGIDLNIPLLISPGNTASKRLIHPYTTRNNYWRQFGRFPDVSPVTPVSTLPLFGLGILVSLLGLFGLRKLRQ